ncbi:MAG: hypothetical protein ACREMH_01830 [Gemmatimonadales bacterium]
MRNGFPFRRLFPSILPALVVLTAGCSVVVGGGADEVPEEQRFILACQAKGQPAAQVDTSFIALLWGGTDDLRERGDTVAWAEVQEEVEGEEDSGGNVIEDLITAIASDAANEALGFRKDTMAMILVPGGADVLRRDLGTRLAGAGYRLADFAMVGEDPATLRAELRRAEVAVKHGNPFGRDDVLASVVVELALDGTDGSELWRRRLEAETLERRSWQSDAEDYQEVIGGVWCDLLEQADDAFREEVFRGVATEGK